MTRHEYLYANSAADCEGQRRVHREYHAQFVTEGIKNILRMNGFVPKILASTDPHFNDIPLKLWDNLPALGSMDKGLREQGDYLTLSGKVCIYKEAAQQIKEAVEQIKEEF